MEEINYNYTDAVSWMNDKIKPALATYRFGGVHMCNGSVIIVNGRNSFKVKEISNIFLLYQIVQT